VLNNKRKRTKLQKVKSKRENNKQRINELFKNNKALKLKSNKIISDGEEVNQQLDKSDSESNDNERNKKGKLYF